MTHRVQEIFWLRYFNGFAKKRFKIDKIYCTTNLNRKYSVIFINVLSIAVLDLVIHLENIEFQVEISGVETLYNENF